MESVVKSEDSPALPFGLLVTKICSSAGVESFENDELQKQMEFIGHTSMTRSQAQSSRSRNAITMETLSNRLDTISARMDEISSQQAEILKMVTLLVKEIQHLKNQREVPDKLVEDDDQEDGDAEESESGEAGDEEESWSGEEAADEEESGSGEEESESSEDH